MHPPLNSYWHFVLFARDVFIAVSVWSKTQEGRGTWHPFCAVSQAGAFPRGSRDHPFSANVLRNIRMQMLGIHFIANDNVHRLTSLWLFPRNAPWRWFGPAQVGPPRCPAQLWRAPRAQPCRAVPQSCCAFRRGAGGWPRAQVTHAGVGLL